MKKLALFLIIIAFLPTIIMGEYKGDYPSGIGSYVAGDVVKYNNICYEAVSGQLHWANNASYPPGSLAGVWLTVSCPPDNPDAPKVDKVNVSTEGNVGSIKKGETLQMLSDVEGVNIPNASDSSVTWSVSPTTGGISINASGLLSVPAGATATSVVVTATSKVTTKTFGTKTISITNGTITSVTISPKTAEVLKGGTQQFTADVVSPDGAPLGVTWELSYSISPTSTISTGGLLSVNANESYSTIKVVVKSVEDPSKSDTAVVSVTENQPTGTITSVVISPKTTSVAKGSTQNFSVEVGKTGTFTGAVSWNIVGSVIAGTALSNTTNTGATLTIASGETATSIKVAVKSTENATKSDTATITISEVPTGTIESVVISPKTANIVKGNTQNFNVTVEKTGNNTGAVSWNIVGSVKVGTALSNTTNTGAMLTIASDETETSIKVAVKANEDNTKSDTAVITISGANVPVESIEIFPKTENVTKGQKLQLSATILPENATNKIVNWEIIDGTGNSIINTNGELSVLISETATQLTIVAKASGDNTKTDTAIITINEAGKHIITIIAGANGTTNPAGPIEIDDGKDTIITLIPDDGYEVDSIWVNETPRPKTANNTHKFTRVTGSHTLKVSFKVAGTTPISNKTNNRNDFGVLLYENPANEKAEFEILTPEATEISVLIYDNQGNVLFTQKGKTQNLSGSNSLKVNWDLKNRTGRRVAAGVYIVQATAKSANGNIYQYFAQLGVRK